LEVETLSRKHQGRTMNSQQRSSRNEKKVVAWEQLMTCLDIHEVVGWL
jgi:hypothetical protein